MTHAFHIKKRRSSEEEVPALVGGQIILDEKNEYLIRFPTPCSLETTSALQSLGAEMMSPDTAMLSFVNFVGDTTVAGVQLRITSTKIGEGGVSRLLQDVSDLASGLLFSHGTPTRLGAHGQVQDMGAIPYHQLQFIRRSMLVQPPGTRLQDWLAIIERAPTRRIERERPVLPVARVQRLDHRSMASVFQRLERLVPVPQGSPIAGNPLALALTFGTPPVTHFPEDIASPRGKLSFDTPENRFARHVVETSLGLIYRFADHPKIHARLRAECRAMLSILEEIASQPYIREASRLSSLMSPSQALAKADGYREVLGFWLDLQKHVSLPSNEDETLRMLEGRDIARLYEYWVFLKILESVISVTGFLPADKPRIHRDELGESLVVDLPTALGSGITLRYNATFSRSKDSAYSTPLKPDVVLSVDGKLFAFDAKYRLNVLASDEDDSDDGKLNGTYKRADLYKMHTYRDAINSMSAAFVVYPGSEFRFFDRKLGVVSDSQLLHNPDGVGAIPLRPADGDDYTALRTTIQQICVS